MKKQTLSGPFGPKKYNFSQESALEVVDKINKFPFFLLATKCTQDFELCLIRHWPLYVRRILNCVLIFIGHKMYAGSLTLSSFYNTFLNIIFTCQRSWEFPNLEIIKWNSSDIYVTIIWLQRSDPPLSFAWWLASLSPVQAPQSARSERTFW